MNTDWKAFLNDAGAEFGPEPVCKVLSFGNAEREKRITTTGSVICDLSHLGLISVSGDDATDFLQGQVTNNVSEIGPTHASLGSYCTPKGRMLALFRMFEREGVIYLQLPREMLEPTLKRLSMFVLRAKVALEDASHEFVRFGTAGADAAKDLKTALGEIPETIGDVIQKNGLTVIRLHGLGPRFEIVGHTDDCRKLWDRLNVRAAPVGASSWDLLDIYAGIPKVVEATREAFVPQMTNLEVIGGVSFKKGCYTGQEIVARTHYLGKVKRRMFHVRLPATARPKAGDAVFSPDEPNGQPIGTVVNAALSPDGGWDASAVIVVQYVENQSVLQLGDPGGEPMTLTRQPYELPAEKAAS